MAVTMYFDAAEALQAHAIVDRRDHESADDRCTMRPRPTEEAGAPDHRGGHRVEDERAAVEVGRHRAQTRTCR